MKKNNEDKSKQRYILTKETLGMTLLLFTTIITLMLLTRQLIFSNVGVAVCTFFYGTFGYGSYIVLALLAYLGVWLVWEKSIKVSIKCVAMVSATLIMLMFLFHAVTTRNYSLANYGDYIAQSYHSAAIGITGYTFGGVLSSIFVYPVAKATTFVGAYVIFSILALAFGYLSFLVIKSEYNKAYVKQIKQPKNTKPQAVEADAFVRAEENPVDNRYSVAPNHEIIQNAQSNSVQNTVPTEQSGNEQSQQRKDWGKKILFENGEFAAESYRINGIFDENSHFNHATYTEADYLKSFQSATNQAAQVENQSSTYTQSYSNAVENNSNAQTGYHYEDKPLQNLTQTPEVNTGVYRQEFTERQVVPPVQEEQREEISAQRENLDGDYNSLRTPVEFGAEQRVLREDTQDTIIPSARESIVQPPVQEQSAPLTNDFNGEISRREDNLGEAGGRSSNGLFNLFSNTNPNLNGQTIEPDSSAVQSRRQERATNANLFDDDNEDSDLFFTPEEQNITRAERMAPPAERVVDENRRPFVPVTPPREPEPETLEPAKPKHVWKKYVAPSLDLLRNYTEFASSSAIEIEENKRAIVETLATVKIESEIINVIIGARFTRYDVKIKDSTNIKLALKHRDDIQIALRKDTINAYVNYAIAAISIEVPNRESGIVGLKSILSSSQFLNAKPNGLTFGLGKTIDGDCICPDITKMPHLLVAGTTGSGKSICLSSLIISLLYRYGPEELRFILIDPKQVEFIPYDNLPHLMINEIISDVDKAIKALNWAIKEMERRYGLFKEMSENGCATKTLTEYNSHLPEGEEKLPKIVIILDEFGDLMVQAKRDVETRIVRLAQKARACGIHLILATQRPSVDCITGLIKSNLPTRIGFKVNSLADSSTIFDIGGAEKLLGYGDMYYRRPDKPALQRVQGCFIDTDEVQTVTDYIKEHNETFFDETVSTFINTVEETEEQVSGGRDDKMDTSDTKIDDIFLKVLKHCVECNVASVNMIQRRFPISYLKACKIIDWMESMNYVTPSEGSKSRKVLLSRTEFINTYGEIDD